MTLERPATPTWAGTPPPEEELARLRALHNPRNEPMGHFTGHCAACGSRDLWDDSPGGYGCNCCGAVYDTANVMPRLVPNAPRLDAEENCT